MRVSRVEWGVLVGALLLVVVAWLLAVTTTPPVIHPAAAALGQWEVADSVEKGFVIWQKGRRAELEKALEEARLLRHEVNWGEWELDQERRED
jgi:hypothetical protein